VSATSGTSSVTSGTLGDVPPVSFPGIASGIDYNSIIEKYTADTLLQEKPTQLQINNLNAQNTAIVKITSLIGAVQDAVTAISNPDTFSAYKATVGNTANSSTAATTKQISGQTPVAGTYIINAQKVATATSIVNDTAVANATVSQTLALAAAGTAITPTNGTNANGSFTINGVQIQYNVNTDSLTAIVGKIQTVLTATTGGTASISASGVVSLTGVTTLGSGADSGNLEQVLKLDTAQLSGGNIASSAPIGGINQDTVLSATGNAGFNTGVTAGTFTINGVQFTVNPTTDSLSSLLAQINTSSAGVTATYNQETSSIQLTSTTAGPQSILLGASADTSNFLQSAGFLSSYNTPGSILAGATVDSGTQASLVYTNLQGQTSTVYSSTNDFNTAIPGIDLDINTSSPASLGNASTFYSVTVAADPSQAEAAINKFITAYNAAISELNKDTAAPTVTAGTDATTGTSNSSSSGGGVLYGNYQISGLRDQLVGLVSGFVPSGSTSYNSLQSVGILLDTNSQQVGTASDSDSSSSTDSSDTSLGANNSFSVNATSGELQALDTTTFEAAYNANTIAVKNLFTLSPTLSGTQAGAQPTPGSSYGFSYLIGSTLASIDGLNTYLANDTVIVPDNFSDVLLTNLTDSNNQQIDSLQQQITLINNEATQQADQLRAQFNASETQIAQLQALQQQIAAIGH
jgi:flagellar hook-associated protein 2